ncbi:MAG: hypothetical protein NTW59_03175 [Candidatus Diapherotrites archaeon]|nr:hypothetical protein [Candidatus Diapherotrites archaeon]
MRMRKGQVFTLDLLISLVAATLAIGLLFHTMETRIYNQKGAELSSDLKRVADNAGNMLAASNQIICELRDADSTTHIDYLNNCIDTTKINSSNAKSLMGIPDGYGARVYFGGTEWGDDLPPSDIDFIEETRTVILHDGPVFKDAFEAHSFSTEDFTIRVWKT